MYIPTTSINDKYMTYEYDDDKQKNKEKTIQWRQSVNFSGAIKIKK